MAILWMHVRRVGLGVVLGATVFVVGCLDLVRAKAMASPVGGGISWLSAPICRLVMSITNPVFYLGEHWFGQAPIPLFLLAIAFWMVLGVLTVEIVSFVRSCRTGGRAPTKPCSK